MNDKTIHVKDEERLEHFSRELQKWIDNPPVRITPEEWAQAIPYLERGEGDPPPQSVMDRIGFVGDGGTIFEDSDIDGTDSKYYDRSWENWNKALLNLFSIYDDVVQDLREISGYDRELDLIDVCNIISWIAKSQPEEQDEEQAAEQAAEQAEEQDEKQGKHRLNLHLFDGGNEPEAHEGPSDSLISNAPLIRMALSLIDTRGKSFESVRNRDGITYTMISANAETSLTVTTDDFFKDASGNDTFRNDNFNRLFALCMSKLAEQHYSGAEIVLDARDLVEKNIVNRADNAYRAVARFVRQSTKLFFEGKLKKGDKSLSQDAGVLFFNVDKPEGTRNRLVISVNPHISADYFGAFAMVLPDWAYDLKSNRAFSALFQIFSYARQEADVIASGKPLKMKVDTLREKIGLPSVEEERSKNRKYKERIFEPLVNVISEIKKVYETALEEGRAHPGFEISLESDTYSKIDEFLNGHVLITMNGPQAEAFNDIYLKRSRARSLSDKPRKKKPSRKGAAK